MASTPGRIGKRVKREINGLKRVLRRKTRCPFANREQRPIILHGSHHKVGTSWMQKVLRSVSTEYGLKYQDCDQADLDPETDVFFQDHSRFDLNRFDHYRGSHMVRDPRDVMVSGYYYHLWTKEEWANLPMSSFGPEVHRAWAHVPFDEAGDLTYKDFLNSLDREAGLAMEIRRAATTEMRDFTEWDYQNPAFYELKYEAMIKDEAAVFEQLFRHYGFTDQAVARCVELAEACSFRKQAKRDLGRVDNKSHMRSGLPGQWRDELSEAHKLLFKELNGDALVRMGYEQDIDW